MNSEIQISIPKDVENLQLPSPELLTYYRNLDNRVLWLQGEVDEYWIEYDECRRPISYKNSRGYSWNCKYNSKGNISSFWDYTGYQEDYKYYARNLVICTTSFGEKIKKRVISDNPITRNMFITSEDYI